MEEEKDVRVSTGIVADVAVVVVAAVAGADTSASR